jgi:hypothetical protein
MGQPIEQGGRHFCINISQTQGGAFGVATSVSEKDSQQGEVDIDRLAVVNDVTNNVTVTTSILP